MKINLGCGTNKLDGWRNHDADVDITKELPFSDWAADFMFAEHVVEHVRYDQAIEFFRECHRVLKPSGVLRIAVPSVERVWQFATEDYCEFASRWVPAASDAPTHDDRRRSAMSNILFCHGHQTAWTQGLLKATLWFAGFSYTEEAIPGYSRHTELRKVEGHGRVIGDEFNNIETVVVEATK